MIALAFADPQTVTVNAVAQTLPRTSAGSSSGAFTKDDGSYQLQIQHSRNKRTRRVVRLDAKKIIADPMFTAQNLEVSMSAYLVVDLPNAGYSNAEAKQVVDGLTAYLTASSGARVSQLLGGES